MMRLKLGLAVTAAALTVILASVTCAQELTPSNVFSNAFHITVLNGDDGAAPDDQAGAFAVVTNGIVEHGTGDGQIDGFDTWESDDTGAVTDFVGLRYDSPARFDTLTIELGNQFGDGGDWESQPRVFLLKNPVFNPESVRPELINIWEEVPADLAGDPPHVFDPVVVPGPGGTIMLNLTGAPEDRVGWGWAVGGVDGVHRTSDGRFNFISITELSATGESAVAPPILLPDVPEAINVVSNSYHSPNHSGEDLTEWRGEVFQAITNGVVTSGGPDGYDTYEGDTDGVLTDFVGLQYSSLVEFESITVDLGNQFGDGGDWEATPKIFVLKNPVDTDQLAPEDDPANWVEVAAVETTGHVFDPLVSPGAGGTMTFSLTGSAAERTGWGWAVGGVDGNANDSGVVNFISITEVSAAGTVVPEPSGALLAVLACFALIGCRRR